MQKAASRIAAVPMALAHRKAGLACAELEGFASSDLVAYASTQSFHSAEQVCGYTGGIAAGMETR